jgi:cell division septum initiation protein DivIVA
METYNTLLGLVGSLFVLIGGVTALFLVGVKRVPSTTGWTIAGIGTLIGIVLISNDRITRIDTPLGTIEAKVKEAKDMVAEIEEIKRNMEHLKTTASTQASEVEKAARESEELQNKISRVQTEAISMLQATREQKDELGKTAKRLDCILREVPIVISVGILSTAIESIDRRRHIPPDPSKVLARRKQHEQKIQELLRQIQCFDMKLIQQGITR